MSKQERIILKEHFETGDRPTQKQFEDLIDSMVIQRDDQVWVDDSNPANPKVGIGTEIPTEKLHVAGNIRLDGDRLVAMRGTGPFLIMNTDNFGGPSMELYGKQNSGRGGEMRFIASEGDMQGFRFLQHGKTGTQNHWYPRLRITESGKVGILTESPERELHVKGGLMLEGDIISKQGQDNFWIGNSDGAVIELHGNSKPISDNREGEMALIAGSGNKGGFRFIQKLGPGNFQPRVTILKDGKMGIGTTSPSNKLEIDNTGGGNTGLQLPEGAVDGYVLLSDGQGNARWDQPSVLNDGDWLASGAHLYNGNSGNVGIGTSVPSTKLEVHGNSILKGNETGLHIGDTISQRNGLNSTTSLKLQQISGNGSEGAYMETRTDDAVNWYSVMGAKNTSLYINSGTGSNINFIPGNLNGGDRAGWVNQNKEWAFRGNIAMGEVPNWHNDFSYRMGIYGHEDIPLMLRTRSSDAIHFDEHPSAGQYNSAPFTLVDRTGERGFRFYTNESGNGHSMLEIKNDHTNFRGNVKTNGETPFVVHRYVISNKEIHYDGQSNLGQNTYRTTDDYAAAMIVGFASSTTYLIGFSTDRSQFDIGISTYLRNGKEWWIAADIKNATNNEKWAVDVLFIRKEMSTLNGGSWDIPLHAKI